jgi:DNA-binding transcriptional regulator GbsR (MarR family)
MRTEMIELTEVQKRFILHWGEMGTRWGINRTVAQVHALLYLSTRPLDAEEITDTLAVARSNISGSLRELQSWGIVKMVHVMNDRRDHFESMRDPWEMFRIVLDERKRREIDPTLAMLRESLAELKSGGDKDAVTVQRLESLREFFEITTSWYDMIRKWPTATLIRFLKLGDKALKFLGK